MLEKKQVLLQQIRTMFYEEMHHFEEILTELNYLLSLKDYFKYANLPVEENETDDRNKIVNNLDQMILIYEDFYNQSIEIMQEYYEMNVKIIDDDDPIFINYWHKLVFS